MRYCKSTIFQANHNKRDVQNFMKRVVCDTAKVRFFKQITTDEILQHKYSVLFAILQKYDFSSKSQLNSFLFLIRNVVCDTAKVRFFKQITTCVLALMLAFTLFAILQKYDFSSKSQHIFIVYSFANVVCDTAKVRFFKQITTDKPPPAAFYLLFAILQKYDFSSKSQQYGQVKQIGLRCLRYCKSTIFQANHNAHKKTYKARWVVCDTAKVRFFKQITTDLTDWIANYPLFAILQKYDFSSKSQPNLDRGTKDISCLRYCKSTIFQANHNTCKPYYWYS